MSIRSVILFALLSVMAGGSVAAELPDLDPAGAPSATTQLVDSTAIRMLAYQGAKKDPWMAVGLELLVPVLGHVYAGRGVVWGVLLFGGSIWGYLTWEDASFGDDGFIEDEGRANLGAAVLLGTRAVALASAYEQANGHNARLKRKLGLVVVPSPKRPALALVARF